MIKLQIEKAISQSGLSFEEVSKLIFPDNKFPVAALKRIIKGQALFNTDQLSKLASLANVEISDLFPGSEWKCTSRDEKHFFSNGDYLAELDLETGSTKLFCRSTLFHEFILHSKAIPLSTYLNQLDLLINNFK